MDPETEVELRRRIVYGGWPRTLCTGACQSSDFCRRRQALAWSMAFKKMRNLKIPSAAPPWQPAMKDRFEDCLALSNDLGTAKGVSGLNQRLDFDAFVLFVITRTGCLRSGNSRKDLPDIADKSGKLMV